MHGGFLQATLCLPYLQTKVSTQVLIKVVGFDLSICISTSVNDWIWHSSHSPIWVLHLKSGLITVRALSVLRKFLVRKNIIDPLLYSFNDT